MKNILVAVSGSAPQILSETLYYYAIKRKLDIDELHVITTSLGETVFSNTIQKENIIYHLYHNYGRDTSNLPRVKVAVLKDESGAKMTDVRTEGDNEQAAMQIINYVRKLTVESDTALYCSIAGGRKTMSAYMALAMNLFGRKNDTLSHVLVFPQEREKDKTFFYPKPDDHSAGIELAEIPFIRLRDKIKNLFGSNAYLDFNDLMHLCNSEIEDWEKDISAFLNTDRSAIVIQWGEHRYEMKLSPKKFAIYRFLYESVMPQSLSGNRKFESLLRIILGPDKKVKSDDITLNKDISEINKRDITTSLPKFLFPHFKIRSLTENGVPVFYIPHKYKPAD